MDLRWEAPVQPVEGSDDSFGADQVFPHLYTKTIHRDWIEKTLEVEQNEDTGEFEFDLEW